MLRSMALLALCGLALGACSLAPKLSMPSQLEFGGNARVRPPLVASNSAEADDFTETIVVPLPVRVRLPTNSDPLFDGGTHLRIKLTVSAGDVHIDSVAVGAGSARAYLTDSDDVVVSLVGKSGELLASARVRQPLLEHVYQGSGTKSTTKNEREDPIFASQHGKRLLSTASLTVFLPSVPGAARVEVRLGRDKGPAASTYLLQ